MWNHKCSEQGIAVSGANPFPWRGDRTGGSGTPARGRCHLSGTRLCVQGGARSPPPLASELVPPPRCPELLQGERGRLQIVGLSVPGVMDGSGSGVGCGLQSQAHVDSGSGTSHLSQPPSDPSPPRRSQAISQTPAPKLTFFQRSLAKSSVSFSNPARGILLTLVGKQRRPRCSVPSKPVPAAFWGLREPPEGQEEQQAGTGTAPGGFVNLHSCS